MKKIILVAACLFVFGCQDANTIKNDTASNVNVGVRDVVITECQTTVEQLRTEIAEKDKKINWLRKKAKDAGADLTK